MDLVLFTIISLFLCLPLMFIFTKKRSQSSVPTSMFPPGKTGWPIIGESLEFLNMEKFVKDRMQKFSSPIFRTSLLGETVAVMCGPTGNKFMFSNENKLFTHWLPTSFCRIFLTNKEEAAKFRKKCVGFLKTDPPSRHVSSIDTIAKKHLKENWDNHNQVTVLPLAKSYTFSSACKLLISIDNPVQLAKFVDLFAILSPGLLSVPVNLPGTPFSKAIKAANLIRKDLFEVIRQRKIDLAEGKASPTQDILSHMLSGQFIKEYNIADIVMGLLYADHDTTGAAITFALKYLADLPHVYDEVYKEQLEILNAKERGELLNWEDIQKMKYSWNVVCEVMRLVPPSGIGTFREAVHDFTFDGFYVPKGWKLYWSPHSTHKDPTYFPEPEKFDPSRFEGNGPPPYTYVPFGGGPKMCAGKEYARLAILVFIHNVVTKFRWENTLHAEKIDVGPNPKLAKGLPIRLTPHGF